jgi:pyruvate/2-oxoglutarate dehydrogenase complex dihydrolipoamide acyltransferase (E2) component
VGSAAERPVVVEGRIEARYTANVTLAADHRIINGRTAAEYLTRVKEIVESGEIE